MKVFRRFKSKHDDYIHDIAYDFYGKRLATCSSDRKIKIWDQNSVSEWKMTEEITGGHSGSVYKLSWAHPEFGQILASCSSDRAVNIYEERVDSRSQKSKWRLQCKLSESRDSVQDIQFAPRQMGLKLATCSLDGRVRIYESNDVMNLSAWPLVQEFEAGKKDCYSISWNSSLFDPPMMAVACANTLRIWECHSQSQRWQVVCDFDGFTDPIHHVAWAPNMGRTYHLIATASKDGIVRIHKLFVPKNKLQYQYECVAKLTEHKAEVWRVSWNLSGTMLASTGDDGACRLWKNDFKSGKWHAALFASSQGQEKTSESKESSNEFKM